MKSLKKLVVGTLIFLNLSCAPYVVDKSGKNHPPGSGFESRWELLQKRGFKFQTLGPKANFNAKWHEWVNGIFAGGDTLKVRYFDKDVLGEGNPLRNSVIVYYQNSGTILEEFEIGKYMNRESIRKIGQNELSYYYKIKPNERIPDKTIIFQRAR